MYKFSNNINKFSNNINKFSNNINKFSKSPMFQSDFTQGKFDDILFTDKTLYSPTAISTQSITPPTQSITPPTKIHDQPLDFDNLEHQYNLNLIETNNIIIEKLNKNKILSNKLLRINTIYSNIKSSMQQPGVKLIGLNDSGLNDSSLNDSGLNDSGLNDTKTISQNKFIEALTLLSKPCRILVESLSKEQIASIFEKLYLTTVDKIQTPHDNTQITQDNLQPPHDNMQTPQDKNLTTQYKSTKSSAIIGKEAELSFEQLCEKLPSDYKVKNVTKQSKQGDFIIELSADNKVYNCLVDVKKYNVSIPTAQIKKFIDDLSSGNYQAGILVSTNSKFTGITSYIHLDVHATPSGLIPVLYMAEVPNELLLKCVEMLFAKTRISFSRKTDINKVENIINYINNTLQSSSMVRRNLSEMRNTISSQVSKCQEDLLTLESGITQALNEISRSLSLESNTICTKPVEVLDEQAELLDEQAELLDELPAKPLTKTKITKAKITKPLTKAKITKAKI